MDTPRIFVSHSHKDDEFGVRLISDLRARLGEAAVWYDSSGGLHGGDEWWNRIVAEITSRDVFVVIFSPDSVNSKWVIDEINIAWALRHRIGTRIIPVLYRPCDLRADWLLLQSVSFVAPRPYESAMVDLLQVLGVPVDQVTQPIATPAVNTSPLAPVIERLTQDIHAAFGQEDWETVISKANLLVTEAKGMSPALWRELGLAYIAVGDGAAALPALDEALTADQFDASTLRGKGLAFALLGKPADAIPLLDRAYTLAPFTDISQRLALLGDLYGALTSAQRWEDALRRVQDALRLAPGNAEWLDRQLEMLGRCGRDDDALRLATELVPSHPALIHTWARKRLERDRENVNLGDALRVIDVGLTATPDDENLLIAKLDVLTRAGKEDDALITAASYVPQYATLADKWLRTRFWAHKQSQDWNQALLVADAALQAPLGDIIWPINKAEALRSLNQAQEAYDFAIQTVEQPRYSGEAQAWLALAASAATINNEAEVRGAIAKATQLDGENSQAVVQARQQYLEPYEKAAAQRVQEAVRAEVAVRRKTRQQRLSVIGLVVSVVVLACLAVSLIAWNGMRTLQAQATQTAATGTAAARAQMAVTAARSAAEITCVRNNDRTGACVQFYQKTYSASAPGSCDKGGGSWNPGSTLTLTCAGNTARVSMPPEKYFEQMNFNPPGGITSNNYVLTITISHLTSDSDCAGILTNGQSSEGSIGTWICGDGSWEIDRYDDSTGTPATIGLGKITAGSTYNLLAAVVGKAHIISVGVVGGSAPESTVYDDSTYNSTQFIGLSIENNVNTEAASATMSNFSYTPLA